MPGRFSIWRDAMTSREPEPDYTIEIVQKDGGWIVREGGTEISRVFESKKEADWWARYRVLFDQPRCCVCGSAVTRPDDPWEVYSASLSLGCDWMHKSCMVRFESGDVFEVDCGNGLHFIPWSKPTDIAK
jgi:hypothetical protein